MWWHVLIIILLKFYFYCFKKELTQNGKVHWIVIKSINQKMNELKHCIVSN